jgi:DnaK suppressor protein
MTTRKNTEKKTSKKSGSTVGKQKKTAVSRTSRTAIGTAKKNAAASMPRDIAGPRAAGTSSGSAREDKIQRIKITLLLQKNAILSGAEVTLNELPGQAMFPDMGDQASAETDMNFMLRLRGRERRLLKKIEEALDRIENGSFGICEDCGNEIDFKRLEARPVTTMCIECKTMQEEEEKRREV